MRLDQLVSGLPIDPPLPGDLPHITDLTERSHEVGPGSLFVARRGMRHDGRAFAEAALRAGAAAVLTDDADLAARSGGQALLTRDLPRATALLAERFFGEPSKSLTVVGVTGTNGKTTIAHALRTLLDASGRRCGLIGTIETSDGRRSHDSALTTPFAIDLSRALAKMVEADCAAAVLEVSSHALAQGRVAAIDFDAGVYTNLSGDHLDFHKTMDAYARAKSLLFRRLPASGVAVVNAADPWVEQVVGATRARRIACDLAPPAGAATVAREHAPTAHVLQESLDGLDVLLRGPWGDLALRTPLLGAHNAMNLLQAVATAHALGADREALIDGLRQIEPPAGRLQRVNPASKPAVFVDFAHTDDALARSIDALRRVKGRGQLAVVFGCGGDRDATKRPRMGAVAAAADRIIITSDNPRTEDPQAIIREVFDGIPAAARTRAGAVERREDAIETAILGAADGDVVLIAGKGHEREQILPDGAGGTVRRPFDDAEAARAALRRRAGEPRRASA